eukprot:3742409-Karenia_brevis.AAC.1
MWRAVKSKGLVMVDGKDLVSIDVEAQREDPVLPSVMPSIGLVALDLEMRRCGVFDTCPALRVGGNQCRIGTWNSRALFTANPVKRAKR